jgi:hypothetical protein
MAKSGLVCLLLTALTAGQTMPATPADEHSTPPPNSPAAQAATIAPDEPVITINGVCNHPSGEKPPANCKKVITRTEFEMMIQALQPNLPASARREFAHRYVLALLADEKVREMNLDRGPKFELRTRIARAQALAQELSIVVYDNGSKVSEKEIEDYYHQNPDRYVEADLSRMSIPGIQQLPAPTEKLSEAEQARRSRDSETIMKAEADKLHARAVAGEPFDKLQAEAFQLALVKGSAPSTKLGKVRGENLPPGHLVVMKLKTGEISDILLDKSGYVIYKVGEKQTLPLRDVREDIRKTLADQHRQAEIDAILKGATPRLDETYFGK